MVNLFDIDFWIIIKIMFHTWNAFTFLCVWNEFLYLTHEDCKDDGKHDDGDKVCSKSRIFFYALPSMSQIILLERNVRKIV